MIARPLRRLAGQRIFFRSRLNFFSTESESGESSKKKEPLVRSARTPAGRTHRLIEDLGVNDSAIQLGHFDENDPKITSPKQINEESTELLRLLEPKLDCVIIGVGEYKYVNDIRKRLTSIFAEHHIGIDVMATDKACQTFNYLQSEHRLVAAALFPPRKITDRITEQEFIDMNAKFTRIDEFDHYIPGMGARSAHEEIAQRWGRFFDETRKGNLTGAEKTVEKIYGKLPGHE